MNRVSVVAVVVVGSVIFLSGWYLRHQAQDRVDLLKTADSEVQDSTAVGRNVNLSNSEDVKVSHAASNIELSTISVTLKVVASEASNGGEDAEDVKVELEHPVQGTQLMLIRLNDIVVLQFSRSNRPLSVCAHTETSWTATREIDLTGESGGALTVEIPLLQRKKSRVFVQTPDGKSIDPAIIKLEVQNRIGMQIDVVAEEQATPANMRIHSEIESRFRRVRFAGDEAEFGELEANVSGPFFATLAIGEFATQSVLVESVGEVIRFVLDVDGLKAQLCRVEVVMLRADGTAVGDGEVSLRKPRSLNKGKNYIGQPVVFENITPGTWIVAAFGRDLESVERWIRLHPGDDHRITLNLEAASTLQLSVADDEGRAVSGQASVICEALTQQAPFIPGPIISGDFRDGRVKFDNLREMSLHVCVHGKGFEPRLVLVEKNPETKAAQAAVVHRAPDRRFRLNAKGETGYLKIRRGSEVLYANRVESSCILEVALANGAYIFEFLSDEHELEVDPHVKLDGPSDLVSVFRK